MSPSFNSYAILAVRPATPEEIKLWMEGTRQLDELAGNDKGGRSGLIRQAIDEFLEKTCR